MKEYLKGGSFFFFPHANRCPLSCFFYNRATFYPHTGNFQSFLLGETGISCQRGSFMSNAMSSKTSYKTSTYLWMSSSLPALPGAPMPLLDEDIFKTTRHLPILQDILQDSKTS